MHAELHGKRFVAVGDGVLVQSAAETEHQFWLRVLRMTLGERWHNRQMALPESKRHVVLRWLDHWDALRRGEVAGIEPEQISETRFSAQATGDLLALFSLAYDVYTLRHALALPDVLMERIRLPDQFQGARYELAIAAVFSRAGYEVEWLTARDRKLPEFIATHQMTKTEIAVEAKSRHRPGVLGRAGTQPELDVLKVDVVGLLRKATQKETDGRPFVICIDLNLPHARAKSAEEWVAELHGNVLSQFGAGVTGQPDAFSALFFTNYAWHWDGERPPGLPAHLVALPDETRVPLPPGEFKLIEEALSQWELPGTVFTEGA
jgi:hypothetical protein